MLIVQRPQKQRSIVHRMAFDLIVVGGGHNGLVCAAYAARAGLSVAVFERHAEVGGAAITEEFFPGYRNSAASYTVSLLEPRIIRELELGRHGLKIVPRPLDNFAPARAGPGLELPAGTDLRYRAIAALSRRDAEAYRAFASELDSVIRLLRPFFLEAPIEPSHSSREFRRALAVGTRTLGCGPRAIAATAKLFRQSAGHWLDGFFETDNLKGALGFDSVVGHFASPYTKASGYLLLHHAVGELDGRRGAWGHAIGGMGAISNALAAAAREHGVEIRTGESVERIVAGSTACVVETENGEYACRAVAGAVHPKRLFLELLADAELPDSFRSRIENWQSESGSFRINVALGELPDFRCLPGKRLARHHGAGILITPSLDYLDRAHRDACDRGWSRQPVVEIVIPSTIDATLAPPGRHVASLFCQHFRYALPDGGSWQRSKDEAIETVLATVDDYAPNFKQSVLGLKAYSPVDLERRFGLIGGDIFHGAMIPEQLYRARPAKGYARYRTPVANLYICASGAHPGGGVSGAPGVNAAAAIIEDFASAAATRRR
jgi:phytoene dehydrogenase-like protein